MGRRRLFFANSIRAFSGHWHHRPAPASFHGKREAVLRLLRGESAEVLSREIGVPVFRLEQWRQKAEAALDGALKERDTAPEGVELSSALQRIGELSREHAIWW